MCNAFRSIGDVVMVVFSYQQTSLLGCVAWLMA